MKKVYSTSENYVYDPSFNILEARRKMIIKCLKDFQTKPLTFIAEKLEISPRELHRELKEMKIVRRFHNTKYEIE